MNERLNILLLEDEPLDVILIRNALAEYFPDVAVQHVESREHYLEQLTTRRFDAVLSDRSISGCENLKAFYLAREYQPGLPFIYLSGYDDPDRDVRGLKALGVGDFLDKSRLEQLGPTLERVLNDRQKATAADNWLLQAYERLLSQQRDLLIASDQDSLMQNIVRVARQLTGAEGAAFILREGDYCHYAAEDAAAPLWKGQKFPLSDSLCGWVMDQQQPALVQDTATDKRINAANYSSTLIKSELMVPLRPLDPLGGLGIYWDKPHSPRAEEVRLLQMLADTAVLAMDNFHYLDGHKQRVHDRTVELEAFTYAVSHDLRTPLRHMDFFAKTTLGKYADSVDQGLRENLEGISEAVMHMRNMIEDLLDLSRVARRPVRHESIDLVQIADKAVAELSPKYPHRPEFIRPNTLPVTGDPTLLKVVLDNLLDNAWKFTGKTAAPRVEFGREVQPNGKIVYFVRDNGAGYNESAAMKLFGVFQRLHTQNEFPGTGVGLASVQRIVRKHNGEIWARGQPNLGATFFFTLGSHRN